MPFGTWLNGDNPTQLRGLAWLSLSDTGQLGTRAATTDSGGGATVVWSYGGTIACRVDPLSDDTSTDITAGRIDERSTHLITVPPGTNVLADDRFLVTGRGTFEVTATRERTAETTTTFEATEAS